MMDELERLLEFRSHLFAYRSTLQSKEQGRKLTDPLWPETLHLLQVHIELWRDRLAGHGFSHSHHVIESIFENLPLLTYRDTVQRLDQLDEAFRRDCSTRRVEVMGEDDGTIYGTGFGAEIDAQFPNASKEIREANTCYALARDTACVFHLMRAVEYGLRALVGAVGVTTPTVPLEYQEWQNLLEQLDSKATTAISGWPKPSKSNALAFFNQTIADGYAFKDAVRNVLMHTRSGGTYDHPGAESMRNRVSEFFKRIAANGVSELGGTPLLDPSRFAP